MIGEDLLSLLCCPETHQELQPAGKALLDLVNQKIAASQLRSRSGTLVTQALEAGLVRKDQRYLYPVRQDIPILLMDEAIPVPAL